MTENCRPRENRVPFAAGAAPKAGTLAEMALTATMWRFEINLSDTDRGVYAALDLRVAQHPSESERFMVARVIARCLEHAEGLEFGRGVSSDEEPAIAGRDLTGVLHTWIDVGAPSVTRLHKASKTGARVAVYTWKGGDALAAEDRRRRPSRRRARALRARPPRSSTLSRPAWSARTSGSSRSAAARSTSARRARFMKAWYAGSPSLIDANARARID